LAGIDVFAHLPHPPVPNLRITQKVLNLGHGSNALRVGLSFDVVAQITGLSLEKIQEIADVKKDK
jgi:hypothetical protein